MRQELARTVGRIIARHRSALGLTQEQLSVVLDVDPMTISRFERGLTLPSLVTVQRLAEIFGVSLGGFFEDLQPAEKADAELQRIAVLLESLEEREREFIVDTLTRFCLLSAASREGGGGSE